MTAAQLQAAFTPRTEIVPGWNRPVVSIEHSVELTNKLSAELLARGVAADVAALAAGSFVNMHMVPNWDLIGTHAPPNAHRALDALRAWIADVTRAEAA